MEYQWDDLHRELDRWRSDGLIATFWWRDDDVTTDSLALKQLLELTADHHVPVALAAIPALVEAGLPRLLADVGNVSVLQHGYRHVSHSPAGEKKAEFGDHRTASELLADLANGRERLAQSFGRQFVPVLVPPWNRYSPMLAPLLQQAELCGLSAMWARTLHSRSPLQVNTHIDPVAWRDDRGFVGLPVALEQLIWHLRLRREYATYRDEPTGLLTHHLDHTPAVWSFCRQLIEQLGSSAQTRWLSAHEIWAQ
jgi:hypothetical protein